MRDKEGGVEKVEPGKKGCTSNQEAEGSRAQGSQISSSVDLNSWI